jgi:hypothetical protein
MNLLCQWRCNNYYYEYIDYFKEKMILHSAKQDEILTACACRPQDDKGAMRGSRMT